MGVLPLAICLALLSVTRLLCTCHPLGVMLDELCTHFGLCHPGTVHFAFHATTQKPELHQTANASLCHQQATMHFGLCHPS